MVTLVPACHRPLAHFWTWRNWSIRRCWFLWQRHGKVVDETLLRFLLFTDCYYKYAHFNCSSASYRCTFRLSVIVVASNFSPANTTDCLPLCSSNGFPWFPPTSGLPTNMDVEWWTFSGNSWCFPNCFPDFPWLQDTYCPIIFLWMWTLKDKPSANIPSVYNSFPWLSPIAGWSADSRNDTSQWSARLWNRMAQRDQWRDPAVRIPAQAQGNFLPVFPPVSL